MGGLWRGELSLRRLHVLVENLPADSVTAAIEADVPRGWTLTEILLTDLYRAFTGEEHPSRPHSTAKVEASDRASLRERLEAQRERLSRQPEQE